MQILTFQVGFCSRRDKEVIVTVTAELLKNADRYAAPFDKGELPMPPARNVAGLA